VERSGAEVRPCPSKAIRKAIPCVRRGTKAVSSDRSVPYGRKRSGPFASDFRSSTTNAIWPRSTSPSTASFGAAISSAFGSMTLPSADGHVRDRATIIQRKTGRPVQFEITEQTRASLQDWLNARPADRGPYVFPSRFHNQPHVTARQYARIVHGWIDCAGMERSAYGTHSIRRTKAAQIYRKTGNLRAVQLLLGRATYCP
jgi:hypothetical protein